MADKPVAKTTIPNLLAQNPSPVGVSGQARVIARRQQVDRIMDVFLQMLPSNYVAQVQGPFYTLQFQAIAETIADFQITAQEAFADSDYDYMRPEFLFQLVGTMVFPDASTDGYPTLKGDLTYREFMKRMVALLLQGATKATVEGGLGLLSDAAWTVIEKAIAARSEGKRTWDKTAGAWKMQPGSAWGLADQFEFEVNASYIDPTTGLERFPLDPFILQENVRIVLRALKPAHTLYDYRHLFTEAFGDFFTESSSWDLSNYYYEDLRKFCCGAKGISGTAGVTWTDKSLFSDTSRDFGQIIPGADLIITSGPNSIHSGGVEGTPASMDAKHIGRYRVTDVRSFPVGTDTTARSYTTSPTGLSGTATVTDDVVEDVASLGVLVNGSLVVPNVTSVQFLAGAFLIRVGAIWYTPVGVPAFSVDPVGVEYLTVAAPVVGLLKFNSQILADHVAEGVFYQGDFGSVVEGEVLTFTAGPNAGSYRLKTLLGNNGGLVGVASGPAVKVRVAMSLLRIDRRMRYATSGQAYTVAVDRLGVQVPHTIEGEDATVFFIL